jgi:hypothetical protein
MDFAFASDVTVEDLLPILASASSPLEHTISYGDDCHYFQAKNALKGRFNFGSFDSHYATTEFHREIMAALYLRPESLLHYGRLAQYDRVAGDIFRGIMTHFDRNRVPFYFYAIEEDGTQQLIYGGNQERGIAILRHDNDYLL